MAFKKFAELESKVKGLIEHSHELKRRTAQLEDRLRDADARLARQQASIKRWEKERDWLRIRLRKTLEDLTSIQSNTP